MGCGKQDPIAFATWQAVFHLLFLTDGSILFDEGLKNGHRQLLSRACLRNR